MQWHGAEARRFRFRMIPSKSTIHRMMGRLADLGIDTLNMMVMGIAGLSLKRDGRSLRTGDLCGGSTGYSLEECVTWHNAKYGDGSRRAFASCIRSTRQRVS